MKTEWFTDARFGMFIHFGLYSIPAGVWQGRKTGFPYAEWIQAAEKIPRKEYRKLAAQFDPANFNAEQWAEYAANAGMKYLVVTSKHHDGFALWPSKASNFNVAEATPFKRDILGELKEACRKQGLRFGLYYSHWLDWEGTGGDISFRMENGEYVHPEMSEFEKYWENKCLPQIGELMVYDPDLIWFDTWDDPYSLKYITSEKQEQLISLIRSNSDKCLINSRIQLTSPSENVDFISNHDNAFPDSGEGKPWETSGTMNDSFGYHALDFEWKNTETLIRNLIHNASLGGNYQLNVGPTGAGAFPRPAVKRLNEIGAWLGANRESIYTTRPSNFVFDGGKATASKDGKTLFLHMLERKGNTLFLPNLSAKRAVVLETGQEAAIENTVKGARLTIPEQAFRLGVPVIAVETG